MFQKIKLFPGGIESKPQNPSTEQLIFYCHSFEKLAGLQIRKCKLHVNIVFCPGFLFLD